VAVTGSWSFLIVQNVVFRCENAAKIRVRDWAATGWGQEGAEHAYDEMLLFGFLIISNAAVMNESNMSEILD
jgi:hypothetical protein